MLTVVPTPIGNLGDFTPRAMEAIGAADFVLAEDTRTTGSLLRLKGVEARLRPFHAHNEHKVLEEVVSTLCRGFTGLPLQRRGNTGHQRPGFPPGSGLRRSRSGGDVSSRSDRIRPGARGERLALRTVCLRRVPAAQEGPADALEGPRRGAPNHGAL